MGNEFTIKPANDKLYRFELAFNGEPQNIGIFTGLYDTGLPNEQADRLLRSFVDLPAPDLTRHVQFWFTPQGLLKFEIPITRILEAITPHNWSVIVRTCERTNVEPIYSDEYQVALPV